MRGEQKRVQQLETRRRVGFTLMEVLLVLAILGVIAAMVVPQLLGRLESSNIKAAESSLKGIDEGLKTYTVDSNGTFPEGQGQDVLHSLTKRQDLNDDGKLDGPWIENYKDPWGNAFYYEWKNTKVADALKPAVWSAGPNGTDEQGGGDDIKNWDDEDGA